MGAVLGGGKGVGIRTLQLARRAVRIAGDDAIDGLRVGVGTVAGSDVG